MKTTKLDVRGLSYHIQEWGDNSKPMLFLLHGWMDCGATFKFIAEFLAKDYYLIAPDWRGFGETEHAQGYWFADYFADLECILKHYSPHKPVDIAGHSMGGNISLMYAGIRPEKVSRVMSLEGLGMPGTDSSATAKSYARWLDQTLSNEASKVYPDLETLKLSIRAGNPNLCEELITELASLWGKPYGNTGQMCLKHDHAHRHSNPMRYNFDDVMSVWKNVTARTSLVMATDSPFYQRYLKFGRLDQAYDYLPLSKSDMFVVDNAEHMLHIEQPEAVARVIAEFFA